MPIMKPNINDLDVIISEINSQAKTHRIGKLPEIRKKLKGLKRLPTDIFTAQTIFDEWAFHHGGRKELQFNIGIDRTGDVDELRAGVAFSLQTNQTLPKIDVLIPKVKLFNDYIQLYWEQYADMRMWHHTSAGRSSDNLPASIPPELVTEGVFIFLGRRQPIEDLNYDLLLDDLDRLLPLYQYVESDGRMSPSSTVTESKFEFRPGYTSDKTLSAVASHAQRELDVSLRHNMLQEKLCSKLSEQFGVENVGDEIPSGIGTSIDVVVRQNADFWFYEIKTARSPRACIRQALGQLLEYTFWPGSQEATRLIIVGETALDESGEEYLRKLRERFSLPVEYEQIVI